MISALHTPSELHAGDTTVKVRCDDGLVSRLEVRIGDETTASRAAALLVRQAVLDGASAGVRSVALTLDVSSPACGAVLAQLQGLARTGAGELRLRRAGGTVLADLDLSSAPAATTAHPAAGAQLTTDRLPEGHRAVGSPTPRDDRHDRRSPLSTARRAQRRLRSELAGRPGVCGVGLARSGDGYALRVNVVDRSVDVPSEMDGLPVDVRVTGPLTAVRRGS